MNQFTRFNFYGRMANRIGTGIMCTATMRNLARGGFEVVGFDVAERAEILITALPSVDAFEQVTAGHGGIASSKGKEQIVIECSTLPLEAKERGRTTLAGPDTSRSTARSATPAPCARRWRSSPGSNGKGEGRAERDSAVSGYRRSVAVARALSPYLPCRRLLKDCRNHANQGHERHPGVDGVRILPLHAQLIPVLRHNGPIAGRLICRESPNQKIARLPAMNKKAASA